MNVPFVGLTGGIGAGKSTALDALEQLGVAVLSTDRVVHQLYDERDVAGAVVDRFGSSVLTDSGSVDRAALARHAFATADGRGWLERLLWPRVGERVAAFRQEVARREPAPLAAVVEVPLLFEAEMEDAFDATIAVIASEELRADRAGGRGHESLAERSARQLTQEEKAQRATYVVVNDGTVGQLRRELSAILEKLRT